ncbi:MAG: hypothetical protein QOC76_1832 [Mycobacterium sp.]|jgi:hypothetical protein|nr:hypothetical protein [Mycobacterium sp.]
MLATPTLAVATPRNRGDLPSQPLGDRVRLAGLRHLRDQELLAAHPGDDGTPSCGVPQLVGDRDQDAIARGVPPGVIDLLEAIEVDHYHGQVRLHRVDGRTDQFAGRAIKPAPVTKAGQRIGVRLQRFIAEQVD